jgi:PII-like signaling protein
MKMKTLDILVVRIYITEASHLLNKIIDYLKHDKISGVSIFRAIGGMGDSGSLGNSLLDLSLNLPITVEFFDCNKDKVKKAIEHLHQFINPGHIIFWEAKVIAKD